MPGDETYRTDQPIVEALPALLEQRGMSQTALAAATGVDQGHLSRALRRKQYKAIGAALGRRIAHALDLPSDYFPETREGAVNARLRVDAELRDQIHDELFPLDARERLYGELFGDT